MPDTSGEYRGLAAIDSASAVRQLLAGLPPRQRAAIALRYIAYLPDDEIGQLLGCTALRQCAPRSPAAWPRSASN